MRKIRLIAEAVCLITSMTITPVVTSVEQNDSIVVVLLNIFIKR